ncbi:DUF4494 domain-containing protein [Bacteroides faecis]|jgi:hypothetical protein|uniref:DUF4494 domain-containing protein n=1 Tax=Bacteroides faecis TaxID=674529 RepID=UPI00206100E8|nr:MAG TPA: protein of unknown function (DUF4494) [Caudoviricetes sp.]
MMHTWFEVKIRYEKVAENGMQKKVTEPYLFDALSFTESEGKCIEEMTPFISGEFIVSDIKRANYSEIFFSEEESADRWFKCKLVFITLDEKSGAEKKTSTHVLVQASNLRDAVKKLDEGMKGTMADYQIASVSETPIMDVYPYEAKE